MGIAQGLTPSIPGAGCNRTIEVFRAHRDRHLGSHADGGRVTWLFGKGAYGVTVFQDVTLNQGYLRNLIHSYDAVYQPSIRM